MSDELPVITSIDDLPESSIEEFSNGESAAAAVSDEKPVTKAASKPSPVEVKSDKTEDPTEEKIVSVEAEVVKPKRKRRTKAEMEAARAAEKAAKED